MNTTLATVVLLIAKTKATKLKDITKPPSTPGKPETLIILIVFFQSVLTIEFNTKILQNR